MYRTAQLYAGASFLLVVLTTVFVFGYTSNADDAGQEAESKPFALSLKSPFKPFTVYFSRKQHFAVIVMKTFPGTSWVAGYTDKRIGHYGRINLGSLRFLREYPLEGPYYPDGFWRHLKQAKQAIANNDRHAFVNSFNMSDSTKEEILEKENNDRTWKNAKVDIKYAVNIGIDEKNDNKNEYTYYDPVDAMGDNLYTVFAEHDGNWYYAK